MIYANKLKSANLNESEYLHHNFPQQQIHSIHLSKY